MSERSSSGNYPPAGPAVDTSALEAQGQVINMLHGRDQQNTVAASSLDVNRDSGVGFAVGPNDELSFAIGKLDSAGQVQGNANTAQMTVLGTSHDVRSAAADRAADAAGQSAEVVRANKVASRAMLAMPIVGNIGALAGALPGVIFASRIIPDIKRNMVEHKLTKQSLEQMKAERGHDTSDLYQDQLKRYSQQISVDGDKVVVLNDGESINQAKSAPEQKLDSFVHDKFAAYWQDVSGAAARQHQADANYQTERRAMLEQELNQAVAEYNAGVKQLDKTRGDFSANNLMQFADAGKNALDAKYSLEQVVRGFDNTTMVFAEAVSAQPAERLTTMGKIMNSVAGDITIAAAQTTALLATGPMIAALPVAGAAATILSSTVPGISAGSFSGIREARRLNKERRRASRQNTFGKQYDKTIANLTTAVDRKFEQTVAAKEAKGKVLSEEKKNKLRARISKQMGLTEKIKIRETLIEQKPAAEVIGSFDSKLAVVGKAQKEKRGLTAEEEQSILQNLVGFDQRVSKQAAFEVSLFSYPSRETREQFNSTMIKRRSQLQTHLINFNAFQTGARPHSEGWDQAVQAAREKVNQQLAEASQQYDGSEAERLDQAHSQTEKAFAALKRNSSVQKALVTAAFVSFFSAARRVPGLIFGAGTASARIATTASLGALYARGAIGESKQMARGAKRLADDKQPDQYGKQYTAAEKEKLYQALLKKQAQGTQQVDGSRPPRPKLAEAAPPEVKQRPVGERLIDQPDFIAAFKRARTEALEKRRQAETSPAPALELVQTPSLENRRDRAAARFKHDFAMKYPGRPLPSDDALNIMFNRFASPETQAA